MTKAQLDARVRELEAALAPFVRNEAPHPEWKPMRPLHGICGGPTEADLARAIAALGGTK